MTRYFERRGIARAQYRVSASAFIDAQTQAAFPGIPAAHAVIPNFIDTDLFGAPSGARRNPDRIVFVGRVTRKKGIDALFHSLATIFREHPTAHVMIAGADSQEGAGGKSYRDELIGGLPEAIRDRVNFLGRVDRSAMPQLYSEAAILAMPGEAEAFGIAALEAMACGCAPVIGLRGGPAEFIRDGATGLAADPASAEKYAAAVLRLLNDQALRESIGETAIADVRSRFSREVVISMNENFYAKVISKK